MPSMVLMSATQPPVWTKGSQPWFRHSLLVSSRSSPSHQATELRRNSLKLSLQICWVESVISMVPQSRIVDLLTSGTKKTEKQRVKKQRDPNLQNLGNCLPRLRAGVSSQGDSIGVCVESIEPSGIYRAQGRRFPSITHWSLG
jgi:hypothetical protein